MSDTAPDSIDPTTLDGYEPPVEGESTRDKRNRKARNRRLAEKHQRASDPEPPSSPKGRPKNQTKRAQSVSGIVTGVGVAVLAFNEADGVAIIEGATELGDSLSKVADRSPRVAKALDALAETSAWSDVAMAVAGIALPIMANHNVSLASLVKPKPKTERPFQPAAQESNTESNTTAADAPAEAATVFTVDETPPAETVPTFYVE